MDGWNRVVLDVILPVRGFTAPTLLYAGRVVGVLFHLSAIEWIVIVAVVILILIELIIETRCCCPWNAKSIHIQILPKTRFDAGVDGWIDVSTTASQQQQCLASTFCTVLSLLAYSRDDIKLQ